MHQVGLTDLWDFFLEEYVQPLQQAVFIGYDDVRPKHKSLVEEVLCWNIKSILSPSNIAALLVISEGVG